MAEPYTPNRATFPELMTAEDVADVLRVSSRTVRRWGESGHLESVRLAGHAVRFTARSVSALIALENDQEPGANRLLGKASDDALSSAA